MPVPVVLWRMLITFSMYAFARTAVRFSFDISNLNLSKLLYGDKTLPYPIHVKLFLDSTKFHGLK